MHAIRWRSPHDARVLTCAWPGPATLVGCDNPVEFVPSLFLEQPHDLTSAFSGCHVSQWAVPPSGVRRPNIALAMLERWGVTQSCDCTLILPDTIRVQRRLRLGAKDATISDWGPVAEALQLQAGDIMHLRAGSLDPLQMYICAAQAAAPKVRKGSSMQIFKGIWRGYELHQMCQSPSSNMWMWQGARSNQARPV